MMSPFPGMDPYIEASGLWEDFHENLIGEIGRALAESVPESYVVRIGERAYVVLTSLEDGAADRKHVTQADVAITLAPDRSAGNRGASTAVVEKTDTVAEEAPIEMRALVDVEFRESFVEIIELHPVRRLVTTVEVLSPSNKAFETSGWSRYCRKRQAHLEGNANLVEIDLLRGGRRMPMEDEWPSSPYYLLVCRKQKAPLCTVWPAHFVKPLPKIVIPLAPPDPDVPLNLQGMINSIYDRSRYAVDIDYRQPCRPPLDDTHSTWLERRLVEVGR